MDSISPTELSIFLIGSLAAAFVTGLAGFAFGSIAAAFLNGVVGGSTGLAGILIVIWSNMRGLAEIRTAGCVSADRCCHFSNYADRTRRRRHHHHRHYQAVCYWVARTRNWNLAGLGALRQT